MDCSTVRSGFPDALEGELKGTERREMEAHLAECASCREEFQSLKQAEKAFSDAAKAALPETGHLTRERMGRLMYEYGRGTKVLRLNLHRGVVAAAAVATILVSVAVIALSMPPRVPADGPAPMVAEGVPQTPNVPVVLTSLGHDEPMRSMRSLTAQPEQTPLGVAPRVQEFVRTNGDGVIVPAQHVFYDPDESSRWW